MRETGRIHALRSGPRPISVRGTWDTENYESLGKPLVEAREAETRGPGFDGATDGAVFIAVQVTGSRRDGQGL